jgi:ABC-type multidrug transport system permease subunit
VLTLAAIMFGITVLLLILKKFAESASWVLMLAILVFSALGLIFFAWHTMAEWGRG